MDEVTLNYRNAEMIAACPFPIQDAKHLSIQIRSEHGKSKYLALTPKEYRLIELVLGGVITEDPEL